MHYAILIYILTHINTNVIYPTNEDILKFLQVLDKLDFYDNVNNNNSR